MKLEYNRPITEKEKENITAKIHMTKHSQMSQKRATYIPEEKERTDKIIYLWG